MNPLSINYKSQSRSNDVYGISDMVTQNYSSNNSVGIKIRNEELSWKVVERSFTGELIVKL